MESDDEQDLLEVDSVNTSVRRKMFIQIQPNISS